MCLLHKWENIEHCEDKDFSSYLQECSKCGKRRSLTSFNGSRYKVIPEVKQKTLDKVEN